MHTDSEADQDDCTYQEDDVSEYDGYTTQVNTFSDPSRDNEQASEDEGHNRSEIEPSALSLEEISHMCSSMIHQVHEILNISLDQAMAILSTNEWNIDKCFASISDEQHELNQQV
jgi:hypothetical protein